MKYNIVIDLPSDIRDKSIEMSQLVAKNGGIFTLGTQNNFPHISIAHFDCDSERDIEKITSDVKEIIDTLRAFDIKSDKYRVSSGWVDVSFHVQKKLMFLYEQMSEILDKYNCKVTSDDWRQKNAPHITFSRVPENEQFDVNILSKYDFSFRVNTIELFERGEHGTNKRLLEKFKLQSA